MIDHLAHPIYWIILAVFAARNVHLSMKLVAANMALAEFEAIAERIAAEEARRIQ